MEIMPLMQVVPQTPSEAGAWAATKEAPRATMAREYFMFAEDIE